MCSKLQTLSESLKLYILQCEIFHDLFERILNFIILPTNFSVFLFLIDQTFEQLLQRAEDTATRDELVKMNGSQQKGKKKLHRKLETSLISVIIWPTGFEVKKAILLKTVFLSKAHLSKVTNQLNEAKKLAIYWEYLLS